MVSQALTIDVLRSPTTPDLGHAYTQAAARQAAAVSTGEETVIRATRTVRREHLG